MKTITVLMFIFMTGCNYATKLEIDYCIDKCSNNNGLNKIWFNGGLTTCVCNNNAEFKTSLHDIQNEKVKQ